MISKWCAIPTSHILQWLRIAFVFTSFFLIVSRTSPPCRTLWGRWDKLQTTIQVPSLPSWFIWQITVVPQILSSVRVWWFCCFLLLSVGIWLKFGYNFDCDASNALGSVIALHVSCGNWLIQGKVFAGILRISAQGLFYTQGYTETSIRLGKL